MAHLRKFNHEWPNFNELFGRDSMDVFGWGSQIGVNVPAVNILETKESYEIKFAAPGYVKENFKIKVHNQVLNVSSEIGEISNQKEGQRYTQREFNLKNWERNFNLPKSVDTDKIEAQYDNGILLLVVPKKEEAKVKPPIAIEVR